MQLSVFPNDSLIFTQTHNTKKPSFSIKNRRYLGNKAKLLPFIKNVIQKNCTDVNIICDIFSGTGVVGHHLSTEQNTIIFNDILESSIVPIKAFNIVTEYDQNKIAELIKKLNKLVPMEKNYFSEKFGDKFFSQKNAMKIGIIRDTIEKLPLSDSEKNILVTSLLYATDKIANTVGHYDAYRKVLDPSRNLELKMLNIPLGRNENNIAFREDANILVKVLKEIDLLYIDPPYNSRQYSDTYHLLENLVSWKKPEVFGVAAKMNRNHLKSKYCFTSALQAFKELIYFADARYILVSYNNTGDKRDSRSNNRISNEELIETLSNKGKVKIFTQEYREYNAGKTSKKGIHKETLYLCKTK